MIARCCRVLSNNTAIVMTWGCACDVSQAVASGSGRITACADTPKCECDTHTPQRPQWASRTVSHSVPRDATRATVVCGNASRARAAAPRRVRARRGCGAGVASRCVQPRGCSSRQPVRVRKRIRSHAQPHRHVRRPVRLAAAARLRRARVCMW
jgi:hypothetical protein